MRPFFVLLFLCTKVLSLVSIESRELTHDDVGTYHTLALERLGEKYEQKLPKNHDEVIEDLSEIVSSFCENGDLSCVDFTRNLIYNEYHSVMKGNKREMNIPRGFHPLLAEKLDIMASSIFQLNEYNVDEIVHSLTTLKEQAEALQSVDEVHKAATLAALSVAIESSKLWHSVYFDEDHPLHFEEKFKSNELELFDNGHRHTQSELVVTIDASVICADVCGVWNMTIKTVFAEPKFFALITGLFAVAIPVSIVASVVAFIRFGSILGPLRPFLPNNGELPDVPHQVPEFFRNQNSDDEDQSFITSEFNKCCKKI